MPVPRVPTGLAAAAATAERESREQKLGTCGEDCPCFACQKDGWVAGRGVASEKRDRKDCSRVTKAQKRNQSQELNNLGVTVYARARRFAEDLSTPAEALSASQYIMFGMNREDDWSRLRTEICKHERRGEWREIERKATSILDDIHRARQQAGLTREQCIDEGIILPCERLASFNHAQARMRGLDDLQGAVEDFTDALSCYQAFWGIDYGNIDTSTVELLFDRSQCYLGLDDLDNAYTDLRACCSGIRVFGDEEWQGRPSKLPAIVSSMLKVMAKQKLLSGAPRPLYTQAERDSIERDLGLNAFERDNYRCLACGVGPSEATLKRCGRYMHAWFCGSTCKKKAWKDGHKSSCEAPARIHKYSDEFKPQWDTECDENGGVVASNTTGTENGQLRAFIREPETGRY